MTQPEQPRETLQRPPFLLRAFAFLVFPFSREGSLVWWWRMHENLTAMYAEGHGDPRCPFCGRPSDDPA